MSRRTPYQVLGVPEYATTDEIKHAYRAQVSTRLRFTHLSLMTAMQVLQWHPDRHNKDRPSASKRFAEVGIYSYLTCPISLYDAVQINQAYKDLTRAFDLESNFEEPIVMGTDKKGHFSSLKRTNSGSSSASSSISTDQSSFFDRSRLSLSPTTPSSSFKESPTSSAWPKPPFTSSPYHPDQSVPTYENWRAGSDLPEAYKDKPYIPSHTSHTKANMPKASRRPPTPAYPTRPHQGPSSPSHPPIQRYVIVFLNSI